MPHLQIVEQLDRALAGVRPASCSERHIVGRIQERQQIVELENEADLVQPKAAKVAASQRLS